MTSRTTTKTRGKRNPTVLYFSIGLAILALVAVVGSRVWMLRHIKQAQRDGERPFDQEDHPINPYEHRG